MAMRLETENVRHIMMEILASVDCWGVEGTEAEKTLAYISGVVDMANAVIDAIKGLGGKLDGK